MGLAVHGAIDDPFEDFDPLEWDERPVECAECGVLTTEWQLFEGRVLCVERCLPAELELRDAA
jgi:hypothetical protein